DRRTRGSCSGRRGKLLSATQTGRSRQARQARRQGQASILHGRACRSFLPSESKFPCMPPARNLVYRFPVHHCAIGSKCQNLGRHHYQNGYAINPQWGKRGGPVRRHSGTFRTPRLLSLRAKAKSSQSPAELLQLFSFLILLSLFFARRTPASTTCPQSLADLLAILPTLWRLVNERPVRSR